MASVLAFSAISCGETTPGDISRQKEEIEMIGYQLRSYIKSRKDAVRKYNDLIKYPRTEANAWSIEKVRRDQLDKIKLYDKRLRVWLKIKLMLKWKWVNEWLNV